MELNGCPCDGEGCAGEQEDSSSKAEAACSITATPSADSAAAGGGALREPRVAKSTPGIMRLDSLKKNRPRR